MSNIFKNPAYQNKKGYSGFDMSKLVTFSSTVGELLPIYYDFLLPGDKVSVSTELKTRTMELDSAAMMSVTEHIDWFFVPLTQIYKPFGSWIYGVNDIDTSLIDSRDMRPTFPYVSGEAMWHYCTGNLGSSWTPAGAQLYDPFIMENGSYSQITYIRLLDMLGVPASHQSQSSSTTSSTMAYNPMFACAYQKIYMDYYRLSDREENDQFCYNLDKWHVNSGPIDNFSAAKFFRLRYRPWKRDFFTNLNISPVMGSSSINSLANQDLTSVTQWLIQGPNSGQRYTEIDQNGSPNPQNPTTVASNYSFGQLAMNPVNIRTMFAVEKLLEVTRRAGKHYDKQTLAHFGVKVPTGINGEVYYLGSADSKINIGDVIATAASGDNALGQVGGKGYGFGKSGQIQFSADCHGILMGIYSAEPDVDYTNVFVDRLTTMINREDFYMPEYDELGQQPLFAYQGSYVSDTDHDPTRATSILGWQWRYMEYKTKVNTVYGGLQEGFGLGYWKPQRKGFTSNQLTSFLIDPRYLDDVMLVKYSPTSAFYGGVRTGIYNTDPLIHELFVNCKKSSKMSTYGVPNL